MKTVMIVIQCGLKIFELIKTAMEKLSRGTFFEITDVVFFVRWIARSVVPFARICAFVLLVPTMLGLWAWGDDLNVVLFEFLDDAGSVVYRLALRAALVHRRPGPCIARDALGADGCRR